MGKTRAARKICLTAITALLAWLLTGSAAFAAELVVELPGTIECRGGVFYLGEYASLDGEAGLVAGASMAEVTPHGDFFTRDDVVLALGSTNAAGRDVALRMPDRVRVLPESPVAARLREMTNWKWRIDAQGLPSEVQSGAEDFSLPPKVLPGARNIAVKFQSGGRRVNRQAKLTWYQPIVCAARDLERGAILLAGDLQSRVAPVTMLTPCFWEPSQLVQTALVNPVRAGQPISFGDAEKPQVVKYGTRVSLVASVNGLSISVNGVALERGAIGDTIRVRNLTSKKVMTGRVLDIGRVAISQQ